MAGATVCRRLALLGLGLSCLGCSGLAYFPSRRLLGWPDRRPEQVWFEANDGVRLHGWWLRRDGGKQRGTFVQFHGNAGNLSSHFVSLYWVTRHGYDLFAFDYRGYGQSEGEPSQAGLNRDALAAIAEAKRRSAPDPTRPDLVVYGQSLGGAVLLRALDDVEDRSRIRAVVVEGTFHSYQDVAASVLWRVPVLLPFTGFAYTLMSDEYAPAAAIARVSPLPLLVIHDRRDPVIPFGFGRAVYRIAREPKDFWVVDRGAHTRATDDPEIRRRLLSYLDAPPHATK
jgi:uncharacterized protein